MVELLASVLLLAIAAAGALAHWHLAGAFAQNKRVTEMAVFVGVRELELLKSQRYLSNPNTPSGTPIVRYWDRYGAPAGGPVDRGYKTKTTVTAVVNRDGVANTEDLKEIVIQVWDAGETGAQPYDTVRTLMSFGGF